MTLVIWPTFYLPLFFLHCKNLVFVSVIVVEDVAKVM